MRTQIGFPGLVDWIDPPLYYQAVTMHGMIMVIYLLTALFLGGFGNYLIPLMVGARDMVFPYVNMLSYWVYLGAVLVLVASWFVPGGPTGAGWTLYPPQAILSGTPGSDGGIILMNISLVLFIVGFTMGGLNYVVTVLQARTRGMTLMRLPLTVWGIFTATILALLAFPALFVGVVMMTLDRVLGTSFFMPSIVEMGEYLSYGGGSPILFQHLFWFFGHPEVYIAILPGMGVTSQILSTFARKPIFGYKAMAYAIMGIGLVSFIVWGHHMFLSGMSPYSAIIFSITTTAVAVPSAIKTFNWLGTLWGGNIRFTSPMLFALGFVSNFVIGGLSGIYMASTPVDIFIHDTYFIVAHFHYVVAGIIFGMFAALYYWFPKIFGRMMNETLGKVHFALTYIFFNCAFFPMHFLGVAGHMRRIYNPLQYEFLHDMQWWNVFITMSAFCLGLSQLVFFTNFIWSLIAGKKADKNPWEANTLEWTAPSPPGHGNFETTPTVYRGPYEYSSPLVTEDWLPQDRKIGPEAVTASH
jgi:cytochrome c oxidase subunit 1